MTHAGLTPTTLWLMLLLGAYHGINPGIGWLFAVALGRVLVRRPAVWLLDEPLSHLDSGRKIEFRRHLHLLRGQFPATIILVTHDPVEALTLGQRLAVLGDGRLRQVTTLAKTHSSSPFSLSRLR